MDIWIPIIVGGSFFSFFGVRFIRSVLRVRKIRTFRQLNVQILAAENELTYKKNDWHFERQIRSMNLGYHRWTEMLNIIQFDQSGCRLYLLDHEVASQNKFLSDFRTGIIIHFNKTSLVKNVAGSVSSLKEKLFILNQKPIEMYHDENHLAIFLDGLYSADKETFNNLLTA